MAECIDWHGANKILKCPVHRDQAIFPTIKVFNNGTVTVSCWKLTPEELAEIVQTGCVFVAVMGGPSQSPMTVGIEDNLRVLTMDTGKVWAKNKASPNEIKSLSKIDRYWNDAIQKWIENK